MSEAEMQAAIAEAMSNLRDNDADAYNEFIHQHKLDKAENFETDKRGEYLALDLCEYDATFENVGAFGTPEWDQLCRLCGDWLDVEAVRP